jgi:hypothetical protein
VDTERCPLGAQCVFIILTLLHFYSASHRTNKKGETFAPIFLLLSFQHNQSSPKSSNSSRLSSTPHRKQTHQKKNTTNSAKTSSRKCYRKNREQQEQTIKHKRGNSSNHKHASSSQVPVQLHYKPWKHSDDVAAPRLSGNYFRV